MKTQWNWLNNMVLMNARGNHVVLMNARGNHVRNGAPYYPGNTQQGNTISYMNIPGNTQQGNTMSYMSMLN